jgi:hypothetical protein
MLFKDSVRTSKRTPHFTITKINWLTLFKFNPLKTKLVSKRTPHFTITNIKWLTLFKFNIFHASLSPLKPSGNYTYHLLQQISAFYIHEIRKVLRTKNNRFLEAQNLLGCNAMFLIGCRPTFQRCVLPPSSGRSHARTSETSVDIQLRTQQYIPEDSELHTRRRENLKSHTIGSLIQQR